MRVILRAVSRRLRLALLLVALAAAGPQVAPTLRVEDLRPSVTHAWVRSDRSCRPQLQCAGSTGCATPLSALTASSRQSFLPETPHPHSLFQRPPPLSI